MITTTHDFRVEFRARSLLRGAAHCVAKDWITGEVMLLPVPPYVKATIIKVLPDLLQKAFDALPNPEVSVVSKDVANSIPTATQQPVQSTNPILAEAPKVIG